MENVIDVANEVWISLTINKFVIVTINPHLIYGDAFNLNSGTSQIGYVGNAIVLIGELF